MHVYIFIYTVPIVYIVLTRTFKSKSQKSLLGLYLRMSSDTCLVHFLSAMKLMTGWFSCCALSVCHLFFYCVPACAVTDLSLCSHSLSSVFWGSSWASNASRFAQPWLVALAPSRPKGISWRLRGPGSEKCASIVWPHCFVTPRWTRFSVIHAVRRNYASAAWLRDETFQPWFAL